MNVSSAKNCVTTTGTRERSERVLGLSPRPPHTTTTTPHAVVNERCAAKPRRAPVLCFAYSGELDTAMSHATHGHGSPGAAKAKRSGGVRVAHRGAHAKPTFQLKISTQILSLLSLADIGEVFR